MVGSEVGCARAISTWHWRILANKHTVLLLLEAEATAMKFAHTRRTRVCRRVSPQRAAAHLFSSAAAACLPEAPRARNQVNCWMVRERERERKLKTYNCVLWWIVFLLRWAYFNFVLRSQWIKYLECVSTCTRERRRSFRAKLIICWWIYFSLRLQTVNYRIIWAQTSSIISKPYCP